MQDGLLQAMDEFIKCESPTNKYSLFTTHLIFVSFSLCEYFWKWERISTLSRPALFLISILTLVLRCREYENFCECPAWRTLSTGLAII